MTGGLCGCTDLPYGLELFVLPEARDPVVSSQFLHVLKHELDASRDLAFLDDLCNTLEVGVDQGLGGVTKLVNQVNPVNTTRERERAHPSLWHVEVFACG